MMISGRGKRAVLIALAASTAIFLFAEVAVAHKAITDDDDLVVTVDDGVAQANLESGGGEAIGEVGLDGEESVSELDVNV